MLLEDALCQRVRHFGRFPSLEWDGPSISREHIDDGQDVFVSVVIWQVGDYVHRQGVENLSNNELANFSLSVGFWSFAFPAQDATVDEGNNVVVHSLPVEALSNHLERSVLA